MLRRESQGLRLDQNSKLDAIFDTLVNLAATSTQIKTDLAMATEASNASPESELSRAEEEQLFATQAAIMGGGRAGASRARNRLLNTAQNRRMALPSHIDALTTEISRIAITEHELEDISKEQAVMRSLNFPSRPVRHDNIPRSHEKTFRWMIDPDEDLEDGAGSPFRDWLRSGHGIFWGTFISLRRFSITVSGTKFPGTLVILLELKSWFGLFTQCPQSQLLYPYLDIHLSVTDLLSFVAKVFEI